MTTLTETATVNARELVIKRTRDADGAAALTLLVHGASLDPATKLTLTAAALHALLDGAYRSALLEVLDLYAIPRREVEVIDRDADGVIVGVYGETRLTRELPAERIVLRAVAGTAGEGRAR